VPDVFISYNREDRETARLVASGLEAEGFSVWWDAALRAGETYDEVTEQNLRQAGAVVVLWSKRSANSKWVRAEATVGERSSTLVPALIEDCERPIRFELVQTADLRHWRGDRHDPHWRAFMQDIRTAVSRRGARPRGAPPAAHSPHATPDASIETAFWNSIKDGADPSEFEAYLARYPAGHFTALAKTRLTALQNRNAAHPARPPAAAPVRAPEARSAPPKKSASGLIGVAIVAIAAVAIGVPAVVMLAKSRSEVAAKSGEPAGARTPKVAAQEPPRAASEAAAEASPSLAAAEPAASAADIEPAGEALVEASLAASDKETAGAAPPIEDAPDAPFKKGAEPPAAAAAAPAGAPSAKPVKVRAAKTFRDCETCPLMAKLPKGTFVMGSPAAEPGRNAYEGPQRQVSVPEFAIGVYEVTVAEWNACAADGACPARSAGADPATPALGLSWREAAQYAAWLTKTTGRTYRLPTEAEWEYAARAGTVDAYWWGATFEPSRIATGAAQRVGSGDANAFGLHDVLGNAREWVADCYVNTYAKAPADGSAVSEGDCARRVIRGGAWSSSAADMRIANRSRVAVDMHAGYMGVRVAADLD
jgi:formylglycine-generating enzyme required for sulfatase activity